MAEALTPKQMVARVWRPRVVIYAVLLMITSTALVVSLSMRKGFSVDVIKDRGAPARVVSQGYIENTYRLQVTNGTEQVQHYQVSVSGLPGLAIASPDQLSVEAAAIASLPVRLTLAPDVAQKYRGQVNPIVFEIKTTQSNTPKTLNEKSIFFVPR